MQPFPIGKATHYGTRLGVIVIFCATLFGCVISSDGRGSGLGPIVFVYYVVTTTILLTIGFASAAILLSLFQRFSDTVILISLFSFLIIALSVVYFGLSSVEDKEATLFYMVLPIAMGYACVLVGAAVASSSR